MSYILGDMYIMQIKIPVKGCAYPQWVSVRPSHSEKPYIYDSEIEAYQMLNLCYGGSSYPTRVGKWYASKKPYLKESV